MHTIENEELRVMISDHGAELSGIFDKKNNREVLWNAVPEILETPRAGTFSECRTSL